MNRNTRFVIEAAMIAGIYTALTLALAPFSYGIMQVRVSEALTILPIFTPAAVPGLFVGCVLSNLLSPYGLLDLICGSAATLIAAVLSRKLRSKPRLVPLPPVLANGIIIGGMLYFAYGVPVPLPLCILWVSLGELLSCYCLGWPLMRWLNHSRSLFHWEGIPRDGSA